MGKFICNLEIFLLPVVNYTVFGFLSQRIDHLSRLVCCHGLRTVVLNEIRNILHRKEEKIIQNYPKINFGIS